MTISKYLEKNKVLPQELQGMLLTQTDIWTNEACCGYVIKALEDCGKSKEEIYNVLDGLRQAFSNFSVEEAEEIYRML